MEDIEEVIGGTGRFLAILADESHGCDRHCKCGRILINPHALACEVCAPDALPSLLRKQAA